MAAPVIIIDQFNYPLFNDATGIPEEIDLDSPDRFPRYYTCTSRVQSFPETWIRVKRQTPSEMAEAGFYFTDSADTVQCFHCGMKLGSWDPHDDPWIEHARWSPDCEYVVAIKGLEFTDRVQNSVVYDEDLETDECQTSAISKSKSSAASLSEVKVRTSCSDGTCITQTTQEDPLLTPAAQSVIEMGYLPETVRVAVEHIIQNQGWEHLKAENVMSFIMDMEDRGLVKDGELCEDKGEGSEACGTDLKDNH